MTAKDASRSRAPRWWSALAIAAGLVLVAFAERDLYRRSPAEVRGSKPLWRLLCLNALGALAYFRWGRRAG